MEENVSYAIVIDGTEYPAISVDGDRPNYQWDRRETAAIRLAMTPAQAAALFVNGVEWNIIRRFVFPVYDDQGNETGETRTETKLTDCSDYSVAGTITDNRDGTVTVLMGKHTDLELAQAAQAEAENALAELEAAYDNG